MRTRRLIPTALCLGALAAVPAAARGVHGSYAGFTASTSVASSSVTADQLANYFAVAPDTATEAGSATPAAAGDVDTLAIALGTVPSARTFTGVFTVTNRTATAQPATLAVSGAPQVASVDFAGGGATTTIAAGATVRVDVTTSPTTAGVGAGTLRLRLGGSTWLYRDYPLTLAEAPEAPPSLTATPRPAGAIELSWGASATTSGLAGYDISRDGVQVETVAADTSSWTDEATVDTAAYSYTVTARSTDASPLSSLPSPVATASADATPPALPTATYKDRRGKNKPDTISGTAEPGTAITITRTSPTPATTYTTTATAAGEYSVTVAAAKHEDLVFTVTATDAAGNVSPTRTISVST